MDFSFSKHLHQSANPGKSPLYGYQTTTDIYILEGEGLTTVSTQNAYVKLTGSVKVSMWPLVALVLKLKTHCYSLFVLFHAVRLAMIVPLDRTASPLGNDEYRYCGAMGKTGVL